MADVLMTLFRRSARLVALLWLLVAAPLELATALTALITGPAPALGVAAVAVAVTRSLVVALGMVVGRHILQRAVHARPLAAAWAVADLGTLALLLTTDLLPSNRVPGTEIGVFALYACLAAIVVVVAAHGDAAAD